jgi:hypothetical protein
MKYCIKLINGDIIEKAEHGFLEECLETWGWKYFKVNGVIRQIPKSSILWIEREPKK